jgi:hypothetical protein|uniref:Uncharacterized protein n=1 Tax=viral metagenome TaxID=1070528 RepID=A0A6C0E770_9ZZZZ
MEYLLKNVIDNKVSLTKFYIQERLEKGDGLVMILQKFPSDDSVTSYIVYKDLPEELQDLYDEKKIENGNQDNIIFFYLCTLSSASLVAFDLNDRDWM